MIPVYMLVIMTVTFAVMSLTLRSKRARSIARGAAIGALVTALITHTLL